MSLSVWWTSPKWNRRNRRLLHSSFNPVKTCPRCYFVVYATRMKESLFPLLWVDNLSLSLLPVVKEFYPAQGISGGRLPVRRVVHGPRGEVISVRNHRRCRVQNAGQPFWMMDPTSRIDSPQQRLIPRAHCGLLHGQKMNDRSSRSDLQYECHMATDAELTRQAEYIRLTVHAGEPRSVLEIAFLLHGI